MNEAETEQKIKQEMAKRDNPDSVELTIGTPSKGVQVSIKHYYNASDEDLMNLKHKRIMQAMQLYKDKGIIQ